MKKLYLPLISIGLLFVIYRVASCLVSDFPVNSAPLAALFFCGVVLAGRTGAVIVSLLFFVSFPVLSLLQGYSVGVDLLVSVAGFAGIIFLASKFYGSPVSSPLNKVILLVGGSVGCALLFFLFTNTMSWLSLPMYEKNWTGFYQAQWGQHPSLSQPTWVFLRNSLLGNAGFAILLCASQWTLNFGKDFKRTLESHKNLSS